jgi:glycosyltransferase involved in cell wall biosynthesis
MTPTLSLVRAESPPEGATPAGALQVALSVAGRFHTFDLARELHARGALAAVLSAYPWFKLRDERLPRERVQTHPWLLAPYMACRWRERLPRPLVRRWERAIAGDFAGWVARRLPRCDVYVGLSGTSLAAGRCQQQRGAAYVCDRGSSHIAEQDALLRAEHAEWGLAFDGVDPRVIEREQAEYAAADLITVPSAFAFDSFVRRGVPAAKLRLLPYGVNLQRFAPVAEPDPNTFDLLFVGGMSLRKGLPYLLQAFVRLRHPRKSLSLAGVPSPRLIERMRTLGLWSGDIRVLGHVPQPQLKALYSRSHALVLPSIEDGFGLVLAQAMACGCPVLASEHTGARDLYADGVEGYVVPMRDAAALAQRLQQLADDAALRARLAAAALARVRGIGGWSEYGERALAIYREAAQIVRAGVSVGVRA